eukprot:TRINITY_DN543_c0_g1_i2.p1 TRINITY_DN543_c0_g1~~TRINITY_DN543_c0_g1_i2.p1  ORF type:complete len:286 (-),score=81.32 TRINITY_DN543_c0_g1_i2:72-929(-)
MTIAQVAKTAERSDIVVPKFDQVESCFDTWGVTVAQRRDFFRLGAEMCTLLKNKQESYNMSVKFVNTYQGAPQSELSRVVPDAAALVTLALNLPTLFEMEDLLHMDAIAFLAKPTTTATTTATTAATSTTTTTTPNPTHILLVKLLRVLVNGAFTDFTAFTTENPSFFTETEVNKQTCEEKMKILTMVTLASSPHPVPFKAVAEAIGGVTAAEAEQCLIRAVSAGAISAKINQVTASARLRPLVCRSFGKEQWEQVGLQLHGWRNSVAGLLQVLHAVHASPPNSQ